MAKKIAYDWKKTASKFLWALGEILLAGAIAYATERPEFLGLVPILEAFRNYLKHKDS